MRRRGESDPECISHGCGLLGCGPPGYKMSVATARANAWTQTILRHAGVMPSLLLMTILAQTFFPLVLRYFCAFTLFSTWHGR